MNTLHVSSILPHKTAHYIKICTWCKMQTSNLQHYFQHFWMWWIFVKWWKIIWMLNVIYM